jgi:hypothetical protein
MRILLSWFLTRHKTAINYPPLTILHQSGALLIHAAPVIGRAIFRGERCLNEEARISATNSSEVLGRDVNGQVRK